MCKSAPAPAAASRPSDACVHAVPAAVATAAALSATGSWACLAAAPASYALAKLVAKAPAATAPGKQQKGEDLVWREARGKGVLVPRHYAPRRESAKTATFTLAEVAKHDTQDDCWIVVEGKVYDVTPFIAKHPGGWLPIVNVAGKDCTDAFANYHEAYVYKEMLPNMCVGTVTDALDVPWVRDFRALREELLQRGYFETDPAFYVRQGLFQAALFLTAMYLTLMCDGLMSHLGGAALLGLFWQQLAFIGHDLGHSSVTHSADKDIDISLPVLCLLGLSMCYWKRSHNVHHIVANSAEHDPDIQHDPFFLCNEKLIGKLWSTYHKRWVVTDRLTRAVASYQQYLFYPVMCVARVNLYVLCILHILDFSEKTPFTKRYRWKELAGHVVFFSWLGAVIAQLPSTSEKIAYVLVSHAVAGVLHLQILLSHYPMDVYKGRPYNDATDEWYSMQLRTCMDINCSRWMDWFHGGLQYQVEHHLFPRLPRHHLREARKRVEEICAKHGLQYTAESFLEGNATLVRTLSRTAKAVRASEKGDGGFYESPIMCGLRLEG